MARERYDNLDGLRTLSCLGIIGMHIKANTDYEITGWVYHTLISSTSLFVYLFLLISGFGMFCGYYERIKTGTVDINHFYTKRYNKILPFFATLIMLDIVMEHSVSSLIEGLTEMTMVFGLLPNNEMSVIGVGWTLGVIFLFYMLFPFFVWLFWTKKRAWISFLVSILLNLFCDWYFFTDRFVIESFAPRHNFLYCAPFFAGGGMVYLYRKEIREFVSRRKWQTFDICLLITFAYLFFLHPSIDMNRPGPIMLAVFIPWLCYSISIGSRFLSNPCMHYLSGMSLEMYLAHMVIFRVVERLNCLYLFGTGWISYIVIYVMIVAGLIVFIEVWKRISALISKRLFA